MQSHSNDQRTKTGDSDGRRDVERYSSVDAALVAISQALDVVNGAVHLAKPNEPLNLSATLSGKGWIK